jgi:hypothetical protein
MLNKLKLCRRQLKGDLDEVGHASLSPVFIRQLYLSGCVVRCGSKNTHQKTSCANKRLSYVLKIC